MISLVAIRSIGVERVKMTVNIDIPIVLEYVAYINA